MYLCGIKLLFVLLDDALCDALHAVLLKDIQERLPDNVFLQIILALCLLIAGVVMLAA